MEINVTVDRNFLLLTRIRLIVKFYIWPLLVLFGLVGNCLAILVLTRRRLRRTSTNNYLTILAVFDSCYLILTLILNFGSHSMFSTSSFVETLLFFIRPLADFSSNTATWLIVCFTLERTLAVARPIYAKRTCSVRRSRHVICTLLIVCFLITLPTYFESNLMPEVNIDRNNTIVSNATQETNSKEDNAVLLLLHRLYLIFICIIIIWIPLTLLCICNSILIWYVHRSRRFDTDVQSKTPDETSPIGTSSSAIHQYGYSTTHYKKSSLSSSSNNSMKNPYSCHLRRHSRSYSQKRKVTIVLIFCLSVALLLWTPQSLSLTYETLIESYAEMTPERRTLLLIFNNFANLFLCINASIDFILYCFLSEKFARTCREIFWRQCSNSKNNDNLRSRIVALDHGSCVISNSSNNSHHQQQQQLAANTTNNYYTQLYKLYRQSSISQKDKRWKKKFTQTITTTTNRKGDNRVLYRTALLKKQENLLTVKAKRQQPYGTPLRKSADIFTSTEGDYTNNEFNISVHTSLSSNKHSPSNTVSSV